MDKLPIEVLSLILENLSINSKCNTRLVCKRWNDAVILSMRSTKVIYINDGPHNLRKLASWLNEFQLKLYAQNELNTIYYNGKIIDELIPFIDKMCPNLDGLMSNSRVSLDLLANSLGSRLKFFNAKLIYNWKESEKHSMLGKFTSLAQFPPLQSPCPLLALQYKIPLRVIRLPCYRECKRCLKITQEDVNKFPINLHTLEWRIYRYTAPKVEFDHSQFADSLEVLEINPYGFVTNFNFPQLRIFSSSRSKLMNEILISLTRSPKLQKLYFELEEVDDVLPSLMSALVHLKNLKSLEFPSYNDAKPPFNFFSSLVSFCPLIEELSLSFNEFTEKDARTLAQLRYLKKLQISSLSQEALVAYLTNLHSDGPKKLSLTNHSPNFRYSMNDSLHQVLKNLAETGRITSIELNYFDNSDCKDPFCPVKKINVIQKPFPCVFFNHLALDFDSLDLSTSLLWEEN